MQKGNQELGSMFVVWCFQPLALERSGNNQEEKMRDNGLTANNDRFPSAELNKLYSVHN